MKKGPTGSAAIGEILKGLGQLVDKLSEVEKSGTTSAIYGVQVKVGLGGREVTMEPFGNVRSSEATVHETREPVCDVFEEPNEILIIAEMPGVGVEDLKLEIEGDLLTIKAERKDRKYLKELQLPKPIDLSKVKTTANNGVLELRCPL